ncbi:PREDICTED: BTB/POZ domain-containing protein At3g19850 [Tarenaya hassleriana]|uniref:BTB/POZ domain-containing protein At3g19850 n=1 Tax=Tarenaya hassleriana TaxID=28532 RepID=UPI00053C3873|nr:PREDICTED: BTB/POZ domain-containing protein At3g19850 [Tarenaya hassleriana]
MSQLCDLQIHLNGLHTFFLNRGLISEYSGSLRKMIKQSKKRRNKNKNILDIVQIEDFPGGSYGFELVSRFCHNNGRISINVANVSILYCCSVFLGMTEKYSPSNLLLQTEKFLEGMFYWSFNDVILCLKSCERVFVYADSYGLVQKLICALLAKIAQNSDMNQVFASPTSSSSPDTTKNTPEPIKQCTSRSFSCRTSKEWWFEDMAILAPQIIGKLIKNLDAYKTSNNSLVITRFLLQYLKTRLQIGSNNAELMKNKLEYADLADTAVQGVISVGKSAFSCRKLFWILRVLSGFSLSRESRIGLENLIGEMLDQATLDDLLICGNSRDKGLFYDVDLVIRLLKVLVNNNNQESSQNMKEIGKLIDKYLREISPDQNLKVSKFLGVVESLPDSARDCFDGVYRAIDIYLESHQNLSLEDRTKLCRCLNYKKLTLETCKQLAKDPKIPPNVAVEALKSQHLNASSASAAKDYPFVNKKSIRRYSESKPSLMFFEGYEVEDKDERNDVRIHLERMQCKVLESEKICKEMKGQVPRLVKHGHTHSLGSPMPRLC